MLHWCSVQSEKKLVLETIPGLLKESEEISKPRKSSKFVKNTSSAVNKVAALAKQHFEHSSQGKEENIGKSKSKKKKRSCQIKERKSDKKAKSAGTGVKNAPTLAQVERDSRSEKISKPSSMTSTDERAIKLTPKHELKAETELRQVSQAPIVTRVRPTNQKVRNLPLPSKFQKGSTRAKDFTPLEIGKWIQF